MNKLLIIQTASLGDVILATSVAETLRLKFPAAQLDYLIKKDYADLFKGHPFINNVILWDKSTNKYQNLFKIIKQVRGEKYDAVVNIQRFASSGLISAFSGAKFRSGFSKNPLSFTYTHVVKHEITGNNHEIERNARLIAPLVAGAKPERPGLYPSRNDNELTGIYKDRPYVTISPASLYFTKQFPPHKWIELINTLKKEYQIYLLGSKKDSEMCEEIVSAAMNENVTNLAGRLSFLQSAALMKNAAMNYVNDSAPQHIASAVNAPVTAIFCSTVPTFGFGPLSDKSEIVQTTEILKCKPCGLHGHNACPEGHFKCAETISITQLLF